MILDTPYSVRSILASGDQHGPDEDTCATSGHIKTRVASAIHNGDGTAVVSIGWQCLICPNYRLKSVETINAEDS